MEWFSPITDGKEWCGQCESRKTAIGAMLCQSRFCHLKALLPMAEASGFKDAPQPIPPPVDVAPEIIARAESARNKLSESRAMEKTPVPPTPSKKRRVGLSPKQERLLREMKKRAGPDGTVKISFADIFEEVGVASVSCVSPLMQALERSKQISIVDRPGGRAKTRYLIHGMVQQVVAEVPATGAVELPAPKVKVRCRLDADMIEQPLFRIDEPKDPPTQCCATCRFAKIYGIGELRCRRMPPTGSGFPKTKPAEWCGEWKIDT